MVGRMYGWGDGVKTLPLELVLVVTRRNLVSDLMTRFGLSGHSVWDMVDSTPEEIAEGVVSAFFDTKGEEH